MTQVTGVGDEIAELVHDEFDGTPPDAPSDDGPGEPEVPEEPEEEDSP